MSTVNSVLDDDNSNLSVSSSAPSLTSSDNRDNLAVGADFTMDAGLQQAMGE